MTDRQIVERTMNQQLARHIHEPPAREPPTVAEINVLVAEGSQIVHSLARGLMLLRKDEVAGACQLEGIMVRMLELLQEVRDIARAGEQS